MSNEKKTSNEQIPCSNDLNRQNNIIANSSKTGANLQIKPLHLYRIIDNYGNQQTCSEKFIVLATVGGKNPTCALVELEQEDLIDQRALNLKLGKYFVGIKFTFLKYGLETFQKQLREMSLCKIQYARAGTQNDGYVWGNAFLNYATFEFGLIPKQVPEKDYDCMENSLVDINCACIPMIYPSNVAPQVISQVAFHNFVNTFNRYDVLISTGAALAVVFRDVFMKCMGYMPSIFFFGCPQSGKTKVMEFISGIYGFPNNSTHIAGDSTPYAISRYLDTLVCIPVFVDDLTAPVLSKIEPIVKNIFSGISRARGKKDGLEKITVNSTIVGTANDFWPEPTPQLLSRTLYANIKPEDFDLSGYRYHQQEQRQELSLILPLLLGYRNMIPDIYKVVLNEISNLTMQHGKRHIFSLAISCTMWEIVNRIVGTQIVDWRKIAIEYDKFYQEEVTPDVSGADHILNAIAQMIENEKLEYDTDYRLTGQSDLRINVPKFVEKHNIYLSDSKGILTEKGFRRIVGNDPRFDCSSIPLTGIGRVIRIDISQREYLLEKVTKLKNMHASIDTQRNTILNSAPTDCNLTLPPPFDELCKTTTIPKPLDVSNIQNKISGDMNNG